MEESTMKTVPDGTHLQQLKKTGGQRISRRERRPLQLLRETVGGSLVGERLAPVLVPTTTGVSPNDDQSKQKTRPAVQPCSSTEVAEPPSSTSVPCGDAHDDTPAPDDLLLERVDVTPPKAPGIGKRRRSQRPVRDSTAQQTAADHSRPQHSTLRMPGTDAALNALFTVVELESHLLDAGAHDVVVECRAEDMEEERGKEEEAAGVKVRETAATPALEQYWHESVGFVRWAPDRPHVGSSTSFTAESMGYLGRLTGGDKSSGEDTGSLWDWMRDAARPKASVWSRTAIFGEEGTGGRPQAESGLGGLSDAGGLWGGLLAGGCAGPAMGMRGNRVEVWGSLCALTDVEERERGHPRSRWVERDGREGADEFASGTSASGKRKRRCQGLGDA